MRKKTINVLLAGLAVAGAASLLALPAAVAAATPTAISFNGSRQVVSTTYGPGATFHNVSDGSLVASGAINASFGVVDTAAVVQMSRQSTHFGTVHIDSVLTGDGGTITMGIQGQFVSANPDGIETVRGHWTIITGTGSYTDLHGNGTYGSSIDTSTHVITETLTGFVFYGS